MKFILGEKIVMTQRFSEDGSVVPVTVIQAGPCVVTQIKQTATDGYNAVQLGYGQPKHPTKPQQGHLKKMGQAKYIHEFIPDEQAGLKKGDHITVSVFKVGDHVTVSGVSKGKGFQGVVRRHGFSGSPATHGHKDQLRMPGSIGATAPQRVLKGRRMAGHMGDQRVTVKNLQIIDIDSPLNLLFVKGAVPGASHGLVSVTAPGELKLSAETPVKSASDSADKSTRTAEEKK
jgi:large subunit ribosomal protein L3